MKVNRLAILLTILLLLIGFELAPMATGDNASAASGLSADFQTATVELEVPTDRVKATSAPYSLSNPHKFQIKYTHTVKNMGPEALSKLDIWSLVPTNTNAQLILDFQIEPEPAEYLYDEWGQRVAHYIKQGVEADSQFEIAWTATAVIYDIKYDINLNNAGTIEQVPWWIKKNYTIDEEKYNIYSPIVQEAAKIAVGDEENLYYMVKKIYDFVVSNLDYKFEGGWDDAATVLARGNGSCSEYSFVFTALCRANGIPARYVGGTRHRQDGYYEDKTFHRAVEVYFPSYGWVPVDATLADTQEAGYEYLYALKNDFFVIATAGGQSEPLRWNYHSYCKWDYVQEESTVESTRLIQWMPR